MPEVAGRVSWRRDAVAVEDTVSVSMEVVVMSGEVEKPHAVSVPREITLLESRGEAVARDNDEEAICDCRIGGRGTEMVLPAVDAVDPRQDDLSVQEVVGTVVTAAVDPMGTCSVKVRLPIVVSLVEALPIPKDDALEDQGTTVPVENGGYGDRVIVLLV